MPLVSAAIREDRFPASLTAVSTLSRLQRPDTDCKFEGVGVAKFEGVGEVRRCGRWPKAIFTVA